MIFTYQREVYESLLRSAKAHELALENKLPVKVRLNKLVVGPTGTGKSFLAEQVANMLDWPVFKINASSWIIWGAREEPTWRTFGNWVSRQNPKLPIIVILDELDKVSAGPVPSESWSRHMIAELLCFLDYSIPPQLEDVQETPEDPEVLKEALARTIIFGCGAFQDYQTKKSMGFREIEQAPQGLSDLSKHLPKELVNRFSKVLVLPEMTREDYLASAEQTAKRLPQWDRKVYLSIAEDMVEQAITDKLGARFAELVLAELYEIKAVAKLKEEEEEHRLWLIPRVPDIEI
jgi:SpoVK/Ycf46/Vps4 family AAA+-type ATPase